jgi:hypothetical protein
MSLESKNDVENSLNNALEMALKEYNQKIKKNPYDVDAPYKKANKTLSNPN